MKSPYFTEDHDLFRKTVREFMQNEVRPHLDAWEREQQIPRWIWEKMGEQGFLGINFPEKYGGSEADFFYSVAFLEELGRCGNGGFATAVSVQQYMATAHIFQAGSEALKQKYLTPSIAGQKIGALAITEPNAGSDVAAIQTRAERDGDFYIINGSKTFITNGFYGDFITLAAKTDASAGMQGITLIVVEKDASGVTSRKLPKLGWHSSDTAEIAFDNVRVPFANRVGEEGMGFFYIMESFQLERLVAAIAAVGGAEACLDLTLKYLHERAAFGRPIAKFQAIRHKMAQLASELEACKQFVHHTSWLHDQGEHAVKQCSMAKMLASELSKKIADECLQFFGGYGFMEEYEISRMYRDVRGGTIAGGSTEIMLEIIAKTVVDGVSYDKVYDHGAEESPEKDHSKSDSEERSDMPQTAQEIVRSLPSRLEREKLNGYETVVHLQISGDNGGDFTVTVSAGECSVVEGLNGEAKCVVKTKDKTYADIEWGRANPQMAFMTGKIKISNLPEMMQFTKMFRRLDST